SNKVTLQRSLNLAVRRFLFPTNRRPAAYDEDLDHVTAGDHDTTLIFGVHDQLSCQNILSDDLAGSFASQNLATDGRQLLGQRLVCVELVSQAALQPSASAGDLGGVKRGSLQLRHLHGNRWHFTKES